MRFALARGCPVVCFVYVTNQMGRSDVDFEKGHADGASDALRVIEAAVAALESSQPNTP
jgi:uridine phosphorylase